ncbi:hypothetical protein [Methylobacterium nodulans]|uniref:Uncharacterized protein n=1 Tax=Methylobacterium nodulans (strain LMG 21967 / CNCM I-2342 / ORS 2060) TaxID=460265 RepID=B8INU0_METNO|nr:hypothetical protein [Methylobacterium nodulans]ACL58456.1 conserved hypothetical protein [Methylobacterium nodulans ORS 2060]
MGLLDGGLAGVFGAAFSWMYVDAVYEVDGPASGPSYDPTPGAPQTFPCKAQRDEWTAYERQGGLVAAKDWKVMVLTKTLDVQPVEGGRITIGGQTLTIASSGGSAPAVSSDPAGAAWVLRCRL